VVEVDVDGLPDSAGDWIESRIPAWTRRLTDAGLSGPDIDHCRTETARQIANVLEDETGRWILAGGSEAVAEFAVSGIVDGAIRSFRFDRAFAHGGERWIIDYKTGQVDAGTQSLEQLVARHRPQLDRYRALAAELYGQPVRTALYLTALPRLIEV
ncbi:MAG: PD-(D/E)XK nuclease family protein, partial [Gammaproteobacteria bacterium]|nr:PD-(D/E)XK nuclease family protein [Gammaproteobacteria bacterium]